MDYLGDGGMKGSGDVTLRELFVILRGGRWFIIFVTLALTFGATLAAFLVPRQYKASILLLPVASNPGGGGMSSLRSLASEFGGLASLAGLGIQSDSKKAESVAVLQSSELTRRYIEENHLLPILYSADWDTKDGRWKDVDSRNIPTLWIASRRFRGKIRSVTTDSRTGLVTLTIEWRDPVLAAKWANGLVAMVNDYLRNQAISLYQRHISYLTAEALKTNAVEVKQAIYTVLEGQINEEMLARGTEQYAFKVLDPAIPPERASFPPKVLWILGGLFGGLFVSGSLVILKAAIV